jgi:hypothetical protein
VDLDDGVGAVVLAAEQLRQLERRQLRLDRGNLRTELAEGVAVAFLRQLEEDLRLVDALTLPLPAVERPADGGGLAADLLGALGVLPEVGRRAEGA